MYQDKCCSFKRDLAPNLAPESLERSGRNDARLGLGPVVQRREGHWPAEGRESGERTISSVLNCPRGRSVRSLHRQLRGTSLALGRDGDLATYNNGRMFTCQHWNEGLGI